MLKDSEVGTLLAKGLNQSEIAKLTGTSVSTVSRIRSKLRRKYFQEHPELASLTESNAFVGFLRAAQPQWNLHEIVDVFTKQDFAFFKEHSGDAIITFRASRDAKDILSIFAKNNGTSTNKFSREAEFEKLEKIIHGDEKND